MAADIAMLKQELNNLKCSRRPDVIEPRKVSFKSSKQAKVEEIKLQQPAAAIVPEVVIAKVEEVSMNLSATNPVSRSEESPSPLPSVQPTELLTVGDCPDDEGYIKVSSGKNKKRKHKVVFGSSACSSETPNFSGVPRRLLLYVGRAEKSTSTDDITKYLHKKFPHGDFLCESLFAGVSYRSFKVDAPVTLREDLFRSETWPQGVKVGKFFPSKRFKGVKDAASFSFDDPSTESSVKTQIPVADAASDITDVSDEPMVINNSSQASSIVTRAKNGIVKGKQK
jgi:hypothetical protein